MWNDFAEFILTQATENPTKIVEIAVGKFDGVYPVSYTHLTLPTN